MITLILRHITDQLQKFHDQLLQEFRREIRNSEAQIRADFWELVQKQKKSSGNRQRKRSLA
jgi:hypothetical protein